MDAERRNVAARKALGAFEPVMLEDLPEGERDAAWATADVIVSMGFPREFPADFRAKAPQVRLIQSLVAGVDHLPFERFPPAAIVCGNAGAYNVSVAEHAMALLLASTKDDAILVNIARGRLIVEDDLFEHLKSHPRFRAALDTWWTYPDTKQGRPFHRPFQDLPNVVMTPHVAPMVPGQRAAAMEAALDNVIRFLRGDEPRHRIDPKEYAKAAGR